MVLIASGHTMLCPAGVRPAKPAALLAEEHSGKVVPEQPVILAAIAPRRKFPHKQRSSQESNATSVSLAFVEVALRLHFQEVADHLVTALGQY
jgi:hypothetical protein